MTKLLRYALGLSLTALYISDETDWDDQLKLKIKLWTIVAVIVHLAWLAIRLTRHKFRSNADDSPPFLGDYLLILISSLTIYNQDIANWEASIVHYCHLAIFIYLLFAGIYLIAKHYETAFGLILFGHILIGYIAYHSTLEAVREEWGNTQVGSFWAKPNFNAEYYVILIEESEDEIDTLRLKAKISVQQIFGDYVAGEDFYGDELIKAYEDQVILLKKLEGFDELDSFEFCQLRVEQIVDCKLGGKDAKLLLTRDQVVSKKYMH
jgi:hypothetical protein